MNEVLPRIAIVGGRGNRIIKGSADRMIGGRDKHRVIPRIGGVSAREVLNTAGITRGGMVKVESGARAKKRVELPKKELPKVAAVAETEPLVQEEKPRAAEPLFVKVAPMTETEERLTGLLEAAQEMKPLADKVEGSGAIFPELKQPAQDVEQMSRKKRRRHKRKSGKVMYEQGEGIGLS